MHSPNRRQSLYCNWIGDVKIKQVQQFQYLERDLAKDVKYDTDIRTRIGIEKDAF